jgi:hypothetical protein
MTARKSNNTPRDDSHPPKFHRTVTTAGADIDITAACSGCPWPACQAVASIAAGGNLVFAGEDDVDATLAIAAGIPQPIRGAIKKIDATSTSGIAVFLSWAQR